MARLMYTALRSKKIMDAYEKVKIHAHPSFAPKLQMHRFDTYVDRSSIDI